MQVWYADDALACGRASNLQEWWDRLQSTGPLFGYHPNPSKTWLVVKPEHCSAAEAQFEGTGVNITTQGQRYLGAAVGSRPFVKEFVKKKVSSWISEIKSLSGIAKVQPQAAYTALTHGLMNEWTFLMRTIPDFSDLFQLLEDAITYQLLPSLTGRSSFSDVERELLALPTRHGGLGILQPARSAGRQFEVCSEVTAPLVNLVLSQIPTYPKHVQLEQRQVKAKLRSQQRSDIAKEADALKPTLPKAKQMAMDQASEKEASSWLTTIPLARYGFNLHKQAFRDTLCPRFGWTPARLASHCRVANPSASIIPLAAPRVPCPPSTTRPSETSLFSSSPKCARTWVSNLSSNL